MMARKSRGVVFTSNGTAVWAMTGCSRDAWSGFRQRGFWAPGKALRASALVVDGSENGCLE